MKNWKTVFGACIMATMDGLNKEVATEKGLTVYVFAMFEIMIIVLKLFRRLLSQRTR